MNDTANWKVPKWPFLVGDAALLIFGFLLIRHSPLPGHWAIIAIGSVALGAILGVIPFIFDYCAMGKALEVNALGTVAERIENLEKLAAQISSATNQLAIVEESVRGQSDKTTLAAKAIADRMTTELINFSDFMKKVNDTEKSTLKLEVEKMRHAEVEWLQVLVNILDHVFVLHAAAVRSGDGKFSAPLTNFQNACRDTARRIGLTPFAAAPDEPFNAERHHLADGKEAPPADAVVAETLAPGYTYQGRLVRPALVRLRDGNAPAEKPSQTTAEPPAEQPVVTPVEKPAATAEPPAPDDTEGRLPLE